jgi:hypothetical protein
MATIPQTIAAFDTALRALAQKAIERYPGEQGRLERGLILALNGHVTLNVDGTATVRSGSDAEVGYAVAPGTCNCPDFRSAPDGRCKHRWAANLVRKAQKHLTQCTQRTSPRIAYHAWYKEVHGMAIRDEHGVVWFLSDGAHPLTLTTADIPDLFLSGRIDIAADQRRLDLLAHTDLSQLDSRKMVID